MVPLPMVVSRKSKMSCAVAVRGMFETFTVGRSTLGLSFAIEGGREGLRLRLMTEVGSVVSAESGKVEYFCQGQNFFFHMGTNILLF